MNCPNGNLTRMVDESGTTTYFYDSRGRLRCQQKGTYSTWYEYDSSNNLIQITDPASRVATYTYNQLNQLAKLQGDNIGTISYTYESSGSIDRVSFPNGITTNYDYTARNWMSVIDTQKGNTPVFQRYYQYDSGGNLTQEYSAATKTSLFSRYTYDKLNRLTKADYSGSNISNLLYTYDECGNRLKATAGTSTRSYSYSGNRITSDEVYNYAYYPNGNLKTKSRTGESFEYYYDYENNLIQINKDGVALERYVYDGEGRRVEKIRGKDVTIYHYDLNRQVILEEEGTATQAEVPREYVASSCEYNWITTTQDIGLYGDDNTIGVALPFSFKFYGEEYKNVFICTNGFLTFIPCQSFYQSWWGIPNGNMLPNAIIAPFWDDLNIAAGGKVTYESSADRFVVSWENVPLFSYPYMRQSFQVILHANGRIVFQYKEMQKVWYHAAGIEDQSGKKAIKTRDMIENNTAIEIDEQILAVSCPIANLTIGTQTSYIYGHGLAAKIEEKKIGTASVKVYYYHNDHLGSARAMTDKNGNRDWSQDYYPFGAGIWGQTGNGRSLLGFSGKELDASGLFYFGARYYDPGLGRFVTPDPVQIPARNLYVYCHNNPLRYVDPNGENPLAVIGAIVSIYAGVSTAINMYDAYQLGGARAAFEVGVISFACWGITSGIDFGGSPGAEIAAGAVRGGISGGFMSAVGGGDFEKGMWQGAAWGAGLSTVMWGVNRLGQTKLNSTADDDPLVFDGEKLMAVDGKGNVTRSWKAVSGREYPTDPMSQYKKGGAIPEGEYVVDPKKIDAYHWWDPRDWDWAGKENRIAWGNIRTPIDPTSATQRMLTEIGRGNFFVHGGSIPGSLGCIDLTSSNVSFHNWLKAYGKPIKLTVDYLNCP